MSHRPRLALLSVLLVVLAGCVGLGAPDAGPAEGVTTSTASPPETAGTTTGTPAYSLTDRTPTVWLELFPKPGFTGEVRVLRGGDVVFDRTCRDYTGFGEFTLANCSRDGGHVVTVTVNGSVQWERRVGPTESFELTILRNGSVVVRSHAIR